MQNMSTKTVYGVLSRDAITIWQDNKWIVTEVDNTHLTLSDICEIVNGTAITHLWVLADTGIVADKAYADAARAQWEILDNYDIDAELARATNTARKLTSIIAYKLPKGGRKQVKIFFADTCQWSWFEDTSAKELIATCLYLEKMLGVDIGAGITTVSSKMLQKYNSVHPEWLDAPACDLSAIPFSEAAKVLFFHRGLTHQEQETGRYLVKIDKNSAYLKHCAAIQVGTGTPAACHGKKEKAVGVWECEVLEAPTRGVLPPIIECGTHWLANPTIKVLEDSGYTVNVGRGYVFPEKHMVLAKWATTLWEARVSFRDAGAWKMQRARLNALAGVKDIYTAGVGIFTSRSVEREYQESAHLPMVRRKIWKYRPDWRMEVIAQHTAVMHYNIMKEYKLSGRAPVLVYDDALYYVSYSPTLQLEGIKLSDELGMYKQEWAIPLDERTRAILDSPTLGIAEKLQQFNKIAREQ